MPPNIPDDIKEWVERKMRGQGKALRLAREQRDHLIDVLTKISPDNAEALRSAFGSDGGGDSDAVVTELLARFESVESPEQAASRVANFDPNNPGEEDTRHWSERPEDFAPPRTDDKREEMSFELGSGEATRQRQAEGRLWEGIMREGDTRPAATDYSNWNRRKDQRKDQ